MLYRNRLAMAFWALSFACLLPALTHAKGLAYAETFPQKLGPVHNGESFLGSGELEPTWCVAGWGKELPVVETASSAGLSIRVKGCASVTLSAIDFLSNGATDFDLSRSPLSVKAELSAVGQNSKGGMLSVGVVLGGLKIETWPDLGQLVRVYGRGGALVDNAQSGFAATSDKTFTLGVTISEKDAGHYMIDYAFDDVKNSVVIAKSEVADLGSVGVYLEDFDGGAATVKSFAVSQTVVPEFETAAAEAPAQQPEGAAALRLVPFPQQVALADGSFALDAHLTLEVPAAAAEVLGGWINDELRRTGLPAAEIKRLDGDEKRLRLSAQPGKSAAKSSLRDKAAVEDYTLDVTTDGVVCTAKADAGLFHAAQTLRQLIRANLRGKSLPCVNIVDWPSLQWRAFQDDMTRGPSAKLETLKREADLGGLFKLNLFEYYMEFQYAFPKNPVIGPKDGSLTPEELKALVAHAKRQQMDVLGCQQSFGHSAAILSHPEYAAIRETGDILSPAREETYAFLESLYSDVAPLIPFPWFNVCCDETQGLDATQGPAKEMVKQLGPGEVYARHMRRVHDVLKDKFDKRMMMYGDIILQHPEKMEIIPKDTIMLTWGYEPASSFEGQITPFVKAGYEFFVCPGVDDWGKILPDFGSATINIRNFIRDGAKHHALGMLNTEWKDDACTLRSPAWHGYAWGAECAWTGAATTPDDFNRRIGAVLYGEKGDHFGQAVKLLAQSMAFAAKTENLPHWEGMSNGRFWKNEFVPHRSETQTRNRVVPLLGWIRSAIKHLEACQKDALVNADLLDAMLLGAHRMELLEQRMLDGIDAANAYAEAVAANDKRVKLAKLAEVKRLAIRNRDAHQTQATEFVRLWNIECKPYALERTTNRYADLVKWYDELANRMAEAEKLAEADRTLPTPSQSGLALPGSKK